METTCVQVSGEAGGLHFDAVECMDAWLHDCMACMSVAFDTYILEICKKEE